jgi:hypothetical protein
VIRIVLLAALLFGIYRLVGWIRQLDPVHRRRAWRWALGAAVLGAFGFLLIRLGLNWLTVAGSTAALASLRRVVPWLAHLAKVQPMVRRAWGTRPWLLDRNDASTAAPEVEDQSAGVAAAMSREEALAVLGLTEEASADQIERVSRQLLAKVAPSAATSSPYLARQITRARDTLLANTAS